MEDAFKLSEPTPSAPQPIVAPSAPVDSHKSVAEAIAHLTQIKARVLTYDGKDGMNPHLWLHERGVDSLLRLLQKTPTTELVDEALDIQFEEPKISLFETLYEPPIKTRGK